MCSHVTRHEIDCRDEFGAERERIIDLWVTEGRCLPTQDDIDQVAKALVDAEDFYKELSRLMLSPEIELYMPSIDFTLVYWIGEPMVNALINASLEDLPVLLVCTNSGVRAAARKKFEVLTKCKS